MYPRCLTSALVVLSLLGSTAGCANSAGERTTLWDWMNGRGSSSGSSSSGAARSDTHSKNSSAGNSAAGPATTEPPTAEPKPPEEPDEGPLPSTSAVHSDSLVVNNETISVNDILEPMQPTLEKLTRELSERAYYERVGQMVRRQIIEAVAEHLIWRKAKSKLSEEMNPQIDKTVDKMEKERIAREFGGSEARYEKYLTKYVKSRAEVRERLRRSVIIDSYLRENLLPLVGTPRKQDLQHYYDAHRDEFTRPSRREMFLVEIPVGSYLDRRRPVTDTDLAEARRQARKDIEDAATAVAQGESFEEVAKKRSRGVNKESGGAWGFIGGPLQGRWAVPSKKLFQMDSGQVSDVIEADDCYFLVKAGQVETGGEISFQDAQPQIIEAWRQERFMRLRADFLQKELDQSSIGSLDAFVTEVLKGIPKPLR